MGRLAQRLCRERIAAFHHPRPECGSDFHGLSADALVGCGGVLAARDRSGGFRGSCGGAGCASVDARRVRRLLATDILRGVDHPSSSIGVLAGRRLSWGSRSWCMEGMGCGVRRGSWEVGVRSRVNVVGNRVPWSVARVRWRRDAWGA